MRPAAPAPEAIFLDGKRWRLVFVERAKPAPGLAGSPEINALGLYKPRQVDVFDFFSQVHRSAPLKNHLLKPGCAAAMTRHPRKNKQLSSPGNKTVGLSASNASLPKYQVESQKPEIHHVVFLPFFASRHLPHDFQ